MTTSKPTYFFDEFCSSNDILIAQLNFLLKYCNENHIHFKEDCKYYSTRAHYLQFSRRTTNENSPEKTLQ